MDHLHADARQVFLDVHRDLPRQGPGNCESTLRALALAGDLPPNPRVLDIGCGPGMQTLDLAEALPTATIVAVDRHAPFVAEAAARVEHASLAGRVCMHVADMRALPYDAETFDLIWCEGAAYFMGIEQALTTWREFLTPGGTVAFTEAVWLSDDIPLDLRHWWEAGYPLMGDVDNCLAIVGEAGYRLLGNFVLPTSAWWSDYYTPMAARLNRLSTKYASDEKALAILDECRREIDYYREYSDCYGYLFCVAAK